MHIVSMTGFARVNDEMELNATKYSWYFEVKSVNGKSLDIKFKLPLFLDSLSLSLKETAAKYLNRGSVGVYLELTSDKGERDVTVNNQLLEKLMQKATELQKLWGDNLAKPTIGELFEVNGVLEIKDNRLSEEDVELLKQKLNQSFVKACQALQESRRQEGIKIKIVLEDILQNMAKIVGEIEQIAENMPAKLKANLEEKISQLMIGENKVSEERLAQEVVLYVTKADVREETDRLQAHLKTAAELLNLNEPIGRRLDFLCQELNREANTTCSKSVDIELTNLGMELKALIEQLREQIQNVE